MPILISTNKRATLCEGININQGRDMSDAGAGNVTNLRGFSDDLAQLQVSFSGSLIQVSNGACFVKYQKYLRNHFVRCELTQNYSGPAPTGSYFVFIRLNTTLLATNSAVVDGSDIFTIEQATALPTTGSFYPLFQCNGATIVADLRVKRSIDVASVTASSVTTSALTLGIYNVLNELAQDFPTYTTSQTIAITSKGAVYNSATGGTFTLPAAAGNTGKEYRFKSIGAGTLTINGTGGVDGVISGFSVTTGNGVIVRSDGSTWRIVSVYTVGLLPLTTLSQGAVWERGQSSVFTVTAAPGVAANNLQQVTVTTNTPVNWTPKTISGLLYLEITQSGSSSVSQIMGEFVYVVSTNSFHFKASDVGQNAGGWRAGGATIPSGCYGTNSAQGSKPATRIASGNFLEVISDFDPSNGLSTYRGRNRFFIDNIVSGSFRLNCNLQIIAVPAGGTVDGKIHVVVDAH